MCFSFSFTPLREDGCLSAPSHMVYPVFDVEVALDINDRFSDVLASFIFPRLTVWKGPWWRFTVTRSIFGLVVQCLWAHWSHDVEIT